MEYEKRWQSGDSGCRCISCEVLTKRLKKAEELLYWLYDEIDGANTGIELSMRTTNSLTDYFKQNDSTK